MHKYKNQYKYILSFGCMCSTAIFLRDNGFRSKSTFFDWITSNFFDNIRLVENNFEDVFRKDFFEQQYEGYPHLITNTRYNFIYSHVFDAKSNYSKQEKKVKKRVFKSINNFLECIQTKKALLIYYCRSKDEQLLIENSSEKIEKFITDTNTDIAFVFNNKVDSSFNFKYFIIDYNNIHKPIGGAVSYPFEGEGCQELKQWLSEKFDKKQRQLNLNHRHKKRILVRTFAFFKRYKKNVLKV